MVRQSFIAGLMAALGLSGSRAEAAPQPGFPPVPAWKPSFSQPIDTVIDRISHYSANKRDFTVFRNGTCVILDAGLSDDDARATSLKVLADILGSHPDMIPATMDDGNILVRYNHPAANVVLSAVARAHRKEIEKRHLDGLTPDEVLITPLGENKFDDFGKQALLGRAYMFMDAQSPEILRLVRHA